MPHYKSPDNSVHFLDSEDHKHLLPAGSIEITDDEVEKLKPEPQAPDYSALRAQAYRDEADPLFFKYQRKQATKAEWIAKVEEIRTRWPD